MMTITRQIETMEYKEQVAKACVWSTGLEDRVVHASGLRNVALATHAILGGVSRQKRDRTLREVVRETRRSKSRVRNGSSPENVMEPTDDRVRLSRLSHSHTCRYCNFFIRNNR